MISNPNFKKRQFSYLKSKLKPRQFLLVKIAPYIIACIIIIVFIGQNIHHQTNKPLIEKISADGLILFYDRESKELFTGKAITKTRFNNQTLEASYNDGKLDGISTLRFENGEKASEMRYNNGALISQKEWNEDGTPKIY